MASRVAIIFVGLVTIQGISEIKREYGLCCLSSVVCVHITAKTKKVLKAL